MQIRPSTDAAQLAGTQQAPTEHTHLTSDVGERDTPRIHDVVNREVGRQRHAGHAGRGERARHEGPPNGQVRKQLAGIDRAMRKRLQHMGEEHGLDRETIKGLTKEFHQSVREAYESFRSGETTDHSALILEVRGAFELLRDGFQAAMAPAAEGGVTPTPVEGVETPPAPVLPTEPTVDPIVDPTVDPDVVAVEVPEHAEPEPEVRTALAKAIDSLVERFERSLHGLEDLFERRTAPRDFSVYDASGVRDRELAGGEQFDVTA